MTRFSAVIVDDEPGARDAVRTFVAEFPEIAVVGEARNGLEAVELLEATVPDLLFLDIQMPERDGFDVLEALGDATPRAIVFVTAHDEHALRAFEVHALDYVLKPFGRPRFRAAVERALHDLRAEDALSLQETVRSLVEDRRADALADATFLSSGASDTQEPAAGRPLRIGVRIGTRTVLVDAADIDWVEADGDYMRIHTAGRVHLVDARMRELEQRLGPRSFFRIHRSVLVQLDRIRELHRDPDGGGRAVLADGVRLRVARGRWEELERALGLSGSG